MPSVGIDWLTRTGDATPELFRYRPRMTRIIRIGALLTLFALGGCASQWKVHGGPAECMAMCQEWDMELAGMVGVGNQGRSGGGASACVCTVRGARASTGSSGTTASLAGAVVAIQQSQQQQQQQQQR